MEVEGQGIGAKEGCVKKVQDEMKDSRGNRKIGPGNDGVRWGWGSNHADYFPLIASAPNATQLLHDKCAGALL